MCGAWCLVTTTSHVKGQSCFVLSMCVDDAIQLNTYGFHKICSVIYASYTECSVSVWSRVHCDCSNVHRVFVVMNIFSFSFCLFHFKFNEAFNVHEIENRLKSKSWCRNVVHEWMDVIMPWYAVAPTVTHFNHVAQREKSKHDVGVVHVSVCTCMSQCCKCIRTDNQFSR